MANDGMGRTRVNHATETNNNTETTNNDWAGAPTTIKYGPTDEPNIGLGYHLCPNGDQHHQHEHTYNSIKELCNNVAAANLTE